MKANESVHVLIAEDESFVADLIQNELESIGMKVVGRAANGQQAIELTQALRPQVVMMDIAMPHLDGIGAAAVIQAQCPTPVVILSAHETTEDVVRATRASVGAYLVKPPEAAELSRAITIAIARHDDLMQLRRTNESLQQALAEISTLKGLLPICCSCKKIRDDSGYWADVEVYLQKHAGTEFTHGYCPECLERYFPGSAAELSR